MTPERFELRTIAPQPWKNGAGLTREIAFAGPSAADFDWRISLAEVARNAPFSAFPGIDRCIVVLRGAGMRLRSDDGTIDHALAQPLVPFRFPGDVSLQASLIDGPSSDFNVMTRRGRFGSEVTCVHDATRVDAADATLLLACEGEWRIDGDSHHRLAPLQALLWRAPAASLAVRPARRGEPAAMLLVRLCHDRSR